MPPVDRWPTVKEITKALTAVRDDLSPGDFPDEESCDVRLQVYSDGAWAIRVGDSSYDLDHRGFWGASSVAPKDSKAALVETAADLLDQAQDQHAQADGEEN